MKKYTLFFSFALCALLLSVTACKKTELSNDAQIKNEVISADYSADTEEINDAEIEEEDINEYEPDAATSPKITRIETDIVSSTPLYDSTCPTKYKDYAILSSEEGRAFVIYGNNFGSDATAEISYKNSVWQATINSRDTVAGYIFLQMNQPNDFRLKNITVKFKVTKNGKTASKSLKCIGTLRSDYLAFGTAQWETSYQRLLLNLPQEPSATKINIDSTYIPQVGDVWYRASGKTEGVVILAASRTSVKVAERNIKCTGTLQRKTYKWKNGQYVPKTGETAFVKYSR